jgi:hypothetical protein
VLTGDYPFVVSIHEMDLSGLVGRAPRQDRPAYRTVRHGNDWCSAAIPEEWSRMDHIVIKWDIRKSMAKEQAAEHIQSL